MQSFSTGRLRRPTPRSYIKPLLDFHARDIKVVLTDIDGTLTKDGRLPAATYQRLEALTSAGFKVVPVTGRPAGWCELIARLWPIDGVVGENGAFYFRLEDGRMRRHFVRARDARRADKLKLKEIRREVLAQVPGARVSSDQFGRLFDLAIDFAEDVPALPRDQIKRIKQIFESHGAVAKISNIHVNGWFGDYDKVSTVKTYLTKVFGYDEAAMKRHAVFVGDSPNDEPMFAFLPYAFAVANIVDYLSDLAHPPAFVSELAEGDGFNQVADRLLALLAL